MPHIEETSRNKQEDEAKASDRIAKIRVKNRRKMYLDQHPAYFTNAELELADPLLYDRCVRRFQTAAEREADGRSKGYSGVLEADLYRSEAKLAALAASQGVRGEQVSSQEPVPFLSYNRGQDGEVLPEEEDEVPRSKDEGFERWKFEMTLRFLRGDDQDFDYEEVDESEKWDIIETQEEEERWFEDEEPEWIEEEEERGLERIGGETGIQDF